MLTVGGSAAVEISALCLVTTPRHASGRHVRRREGLFLMFQPVPSVANAYTGWICDSGRRFCVFCMIVTHFRTFPRCILSRTLVSD